MARRATLKARVQETPFIDRVVDEAYTSIVQGTHGAGACKRKGARLVDSLFHIGGAPGNWAGVLTYLPCDLARPLRPYLLYFGIWAFGV